MDAAAFLVFYPVRPACLETVLIDYFLHIHKQHYGVQRDFLLYIRNFIDSQINESRHYYYYISLFSWLLNYCVRAPLCAYHGLLVVALNVFWNVMIFVEVILYF